jgi:4-hydroxybenzoate polyprenyltransferase
MKNSAIGNFFSLVKFSHTIFAMPFALIGYFTALEFSVYAFDWVMLLQVVLCMVFARNAAMAFNRYLDRDIDAANERTAAVRELPRGILRPKAVLFFVAVNAVLFIFTTYFINAICFYLSPIALAIVLGYSYTKRYTALCHLVLGIGLSLAPIGAYLAVTGTFALLPLYFSFAVLCWVAGFDMIYALQDETFDREHKLHSIPARIGAQNALWVSRTLHVLTFVFLLLATLDASGNLLFWLGLIFFTALLVYQHTLVKKDDLSKVNLAFFTTNGFASLIFSIFVICSYYVDFHV